MASNKNRKSIDLMLSNRDRSFDPDRKYGEKQINLKFETHQTPTTK